MKEPISAFIKAQNTHNTKAIYRSGVVRFLSIVYDKTDGMKKKVRDITPYEKMAKRYLSEERDYAKDIVSFIQHLKKEGKANLSVRTYVSTIKTWLIYSQVNLTAYQVMCIRKATPSSKRGETHEDILDADNIKAILAHADTKLQAAVLTMCSGGLRPGELVSINMADVNLEKKSLWIRNSKTGESRYTFISDEAKTVISEWLKVREAYIESAKNRNLGLIGAGHSQERVRDDRLFPFSYSVLLQMWTRALGKAELHKKDPQTKRITLRPHACRKFFSSQLSKTDINDTFIESLLGHEEGVKHVYKRYTETDVAAEYQRGEYAVTIFKGSLTKELEEYKDRVNKQSEIVENMNINYIRLEENQKERDEIIEDLKTRKNGLEKEYNDRISTLEKQNKQLIRVLYFHLHNELVDEGQIYGTWEEAVSAMLDTTLQDHVDENFEKYLDKKNIEYPDDDLTDENKRNNKK